MARFKFSVAGQFLDLLTPYKGISDTVNANWFDFDFRSPEWDRMEKWAHFSSPDFNNGQEVDFNIVDNMISPDRGIDLPAGAWEIYVHGVYRQGEDIIQRLVTNTQTFYIEQSGVVHNEIFSSLSKSDSEKSVAMATEAYNGRITTAQATVDDNYGTPNVDVSITGEDGAKVINFDFTNLRGNGIESYVVSDDGTITVTFLDGTVETYDGLASLISRYNTLIENTIIPNENLRQVNEYGPDLDGTGGRVGNETARIALYNQIRAMLAPGTGTSSLIVNAVSGSGANIASGNYALAEGGRTTASGIASHSEGYQTEAQGNYSHAEGYQTEAQGNYSHAEGESTEASGVRSHAEGGSTTASGSHSHAEGYNTTASALQSHAEGNGTTASGAYSHAEGQFTTASGTYSHSEGISAKAFGNSSHAEGNSTVAQTKSQHVFGEYNIADTGSEGARGTYVEIVGNGTSSSSRANARTLDWSGNEVLAGNLTAKGGTITVGQTVVTESKLSSLQVVAKGTGASSVIANAISGLDANTASGNCSFAEGSGVTASGAASHAEGDTTIASGQNSHAEGFRSEAKGYSDHAEGYSTEAAGPSAGGYASGAHAEGTWTQAKAAAAHAEGNGTIASGDNSHAEGSNTVASKKSQHVFGEYNIAETGIGAVRGTYVEIVGNGTSSNNKSNARTLDWDGNEVLAGNLTAAGGAITVGQTTFTENQLSAVKSISDVIGNLFSDSQAMSGATGITRVNASEYVGTASAFETFLLTTKTLSEGVTYAISFDVYTEANVSESGDGLLIAFGDDDGSIVVRQFDNNLTTPYHFTTNVMQESISEVIFSDQSPSEPEPETEPRTDLYWHFEADDNPENIWHISNIRIVEGTTVPESITEKIDSLMSNQGQSQGQNQNVVVSGGRTTVYCWGDSLTEGVGGYVMQPDNRNAYMAYSYPAWLGQSFDVVNLGARGEDIHAIMARQGADPIVIQTSFTIPASADTPVKIGELSRMLTYGAGTGFTSKSGALVKVCKEVESPGLNPCVIADVEGIIYRELKSSTDDNTTYDYYFRRLEDGTATTVPVGTEVETYAMRNYRNGYAVIWMGANGGYTSHQDFASKVLEMVEYGNYNDYIVILAREFAAQWVPDIKALLTDEMGVCHVIYLMDQLPYRGYAMAGIPSNNIDTSNWVTTDPIKKYAPLLCDYNGSQQNDEDKYGGLHFSAWGYKAIAKLVQEKLMPMIKAAEISSGGSGGSGGNTPVSTTGTDDYGTYLYKLPAPRTFNGSTYLNTKIKLYEDVDADWTVVAKYSGEVTCDDGFPCNILCCLHDGEEDGLLVRYTSASAPMVRMVNYAFGIGAENSKTSINLDGTNVMIIVKEGNDYRFYCNNTEYAYGMNLTSALSSSDAHSLPLIFGARWSSNGQTVQYKTKFTLEDARVYDSALTDADVMDLYDELTT